MNISFGNNFHVYCSGASQMRKVNNLSDRMIMFGYDVQRIQKCNKEIQYGLFERCEVDDKSVLFKDIISVKNDPVLDTHIRNYLHYHGIDYKEFAPAQIEEEQKLEH